MSNPRPPLTPLLASCRILSFFVLVGLLALALDAGIDAGLRRIRTSEFGVWNHIVNGAINADVLITGSSRALTHYDARILQERLGRTAYNIGLNGSQTDMQVARLRTYLEHNRKPELLIHNLDLFSFQTTHGGVYDPGQYLPYIGEPALYEALSRINGNTWKSRHLPLYGYAVEDLRFTWIQGVRRWFGWNPAEDHFQGFKPRHLPWTGEFERFKAQNPQGARFEVEPEGVREMEALLELCRERRISVLLVYSPEYRDMQAMTRNRAEIFARFGQLGERFAAPLWDFSDSPLSPQQDKFYNSQHLNAEGAALFSVALAERLARDQTLASRPAGDRRADRH